MQTLKIKYNTSEDNLNIISNYRKQFSNTLRYCYNRRMEGLSEKIIEKQRTELNNISLIKSYLTRSAVKNATQLLTKDRNNKLIFGGKSNFIKRCQNKITKEEFLNNRLSKLYVIGEANQHGNRMIRINNDLTSFTFKPQQGTNINLEIAGGYKRYKKILNRLYQLQELKEIPITYQLDNQYIYISFDEKAINSNFIRKDKPIKNRIFSIDLNPNYVGWSVTDWKSSSEYKVIKTGVISIKDINDYDNSLKKASSSDKRKIYINNKRTNEIYEISKLLVNTALHYKSETFCLETLYIKSEDKSKGRRYNKLVNNQWNRNKLINNIKKRCNIYQLEFQEVKANYSSFIGNFLYRDGVNPDMVLSSIEISRRGYEFRCQYITKEKEIRKNIIQPYINEFKDNYVKSEVNLQDKFSRCFSNASLINKVCISIPNRY